MTTPIGAGDGIPFRAQIFVHHELIATTAVIFTVLHGSPLFQPAASGLFFATMSAPGAGGDVAQMAYPSIRITNVSKRFESQPRDTLTELSLSVPPQSCLSLLGPSGCGKTTLLRLLMGIESVSSGSIEIDPRIATRMAFVFQEPRLVPWRTVLENVLLPLELTQQLDVSSREYALELLARVGLQNSLDHFPAQLSGGMQMRAALARALVTKPHLLLLDEPFAALDERTRFRLQDLLIELRELLDLQYVFVTHSISEAIYLGDQLLLLDRGGRQKKLLPAELGLRTQAIKLTPEFTAIARELEQLFLQIEQAT